MARWLASMANTEAPFWVSSSQTADPNRPTPITAKVPWTSASFDPQGHQLLLAVIGSGI
jgi:hypothetical protein